MWRNIFLCKEEWGLVQNFRFLYQTRQLGWSKWFAFCCCTMVEWRAAYFRESFRSISMFTLHNQLRTHTSCWPWFELISRNPVHSASEYRKLVSQSSKLDFSLHVWIQCHMFLFKCKIYTYRFRGRNLANFVSYDLLNGQCFIFSTEEPAFFFDGQEPAFKDRIWELGIL